MGEIFSECGKWNKKGVNGLKEGERITWGKLKRMGMMGRWMEARAHMGKG